jgi:hypothetical protein
MSESESEPGRQLTVSRPTRATVAEISARVVIPAMIADAGERATRRYLEFFGATIRNKNTRTAYMHAAENFFAWCDRHQIAQLADIEPLHVGAYVETLKVTVAGKSVVEQKEVRQADREAASGRNPHAVRLAGHRPDRRHQPGACGPRPEACGEDRQDHGAGCRTGAQTAGQHQDCPTQDSAQRQDRDPCPTGRSWKCPVWWVSATGR